jgi:hypothetical protein
MGLEFLDVNDQLDVKLVESKRQGRWQEDVLQITNTNASIVDTHLLIIARGLSDQIELENASEITSAGEPFLRVFLDDGVLLPGQNIVETLRFKREPNAPPVRYTPFILSGQGTP